MSELAIRNRQRTRAVNVRQLERMAQLLLTELLGLGDFELCVHLIRATQMARLNALFLKHSGSTDVITFDHNETPPRDRVAGEIFISVDDAVVQARRFRTSWQSEIVRYVIHGVLHLRGLNDLTPAQRRIIKREENRLLRQIGRRFALKELGRPRNLVETRQNSRRTPPH